MGIEQVSIHWLRLLEHPKTGARTRERRGGTYSTRFTNVTRRLSFAVYWAPEGTGRESLWMNLFRAIPQWLTDQLSEYVDNVDFDAVRVSGVPKQEVSFFNNVSGVF